MVTAGRIIQRSVNKLVIEVDGFTDGYKYKDATVYLDTGEKLTNEQRRKIFALVGDISEWYRDIPEIMRGELTHQFCAEYDEQDFSLSVFNENAAGRETAAKFIDYLVRLVVREGIPCQDTIVNRAEDIEKALYHCLMYRKCFVCGRNGEFHHTEGYRVGMGNNRKDTQFVGRRGIIACRPHHDQCHHDEIQFLKDYHIFPMEIDHKVLDYWLDQGWIDKKMALMGG